MFFCSYVNGELIILSGRMYCNDSRYTCHIVNRFKWQQACDCKKNVLDIVKSNMLTSQIVPQIDANNMNEDEVILAVKQTQALGIDYDLESINNDDFNGGLPKRAMEKGWFKLMRYLIESYYEDEDLGELPDHALEYDRIDFFQYICSNTTINPTDGWVELLCTMRVYEDQPKSECTKAMDIIISCSRAIKELHDELREIAGRKGWDHGMSFLHSLRKACCITADIVKQSGAYQIAVDSDNIIVVNYFNEMEWV